MKNNITSILNSGTLVRKINVHSSKKEVSCRHESYIT